ncbi:hypothetical protein [Winogradskyella alexanderae]|uniref:Uncharacterized protein n=1 Tax=Winogradskyella alexanderae TaxID=2877123 RepID=A0ABS7XQ94_9FLAO|nr:hypothetical protein [Winogradskyella alexanderae]MCA0132178.1 hypothetical protein [Winogradskyella alexanderae]
MNNILRIALLLLLCFSCAQNSDETSQINPETYWGENPWPEIRTQRINQLLPPALKSAGVDCWLVICRENNNYPIADHIGGENAGGTAAFLF